MMYPSCTDVSPLCVEFNLTNPSDTKIVNRDVQIPCTQTCVSKGVDKQNVLLCLLCHYSAFIVVANL